ncbi:MAG: hypothetical protein G01um1014106_372 [Parcubacteria group bacterium Gr01-1014_106]|nr:MAG: hypothetical protein G01um1014106_372 [Parcubacteria group bacterium Gr01-1014_106]
MNFRLSGRNWEDIKFQRWQDSVHVAKTSPCFKFLGVRILNS